MLATKEWCKRKSKLWQRWWLVPLIVTLLFIVVAVPVSAVIMIENGWNIVGQTVFGELKVGLDGSPLYVVGLNNWSTNEESNTLAQSVLPVLAVVFVVMYAFRSLAQTTGLEGFIQTAMVFVIGSIVLGAVVLILSQLT